MYTQRFLQFIPGLLQREGGSRYTNDPADPGGATKFGVSLRFLQSDYKALGDFDHDGDVDAYDIQAMTQQDAYDIFYQKFYLPLRIEEIQNPLLALHVFDHGVNAGKSRAVKMLQRILKLKDDGIFGPATLRAVNSSECGNCGSCYVDARIEFYSNLCVDNPKLVKFRKGWLNRVNACILPD